MSDSPLDPRVHMLTTLALTVGGATLATVSTVLFLRWLGLHWTWTLPGVLLGPLLWPFDQGGRRLRRRRHRRLRDRHRRPSASTTTSFVVRAAIQRRGKQDPIARRGAKGVAAVPTRNRTAAFGTRFRDTPSSRPVPENEKGAHLRAFSKRLMGLEPSTFCMAHALPCPQPVVRSPVAIPATVAKSGFVAASSPARWRRSRSICM
jgi:hypothetical protein